MSNKFIWRVPTLLLSPAEVPTAWSTGEDDFKSFFPTSSSGKEFSASVVLKQIFKFHGWNFLMCYYFQEHHGQPEGVSSFRWRLVVFSPEKKKNNPNKNYSDVVLDHSYTRFPVLTWKFLASETWIPFQTLGYVGYTNHSLRNKVLTAHVIFLNTMFVLMNFGLTCTTQLFNSVDFSKTLQSSIWDSKLYALPVFF